MDETAEWLQKLGLRQYATRFAENGIDLSVLPNLTEQDLAGLGVLLGHRLKILRAVTGLETAKPATGPLGHSQAERRQLTVMFCDLVGSTVLSQRLDPEDYAEVIRNYHETCSRVIQQHGGTISRFLGDGILAYFGYPQAHEDDAVRACRAGLSIIDAIFRLNATVALEVRIACATGLVLVGDLSGEYFGDARAIMGATTDFAARLQTIAAPRTLVVSEETHTLLANLFDQIDLGLHDLRGIETPVRGWRVLSERVHESRFSARLFGRTSDFVGRQHEVDTLLASWSAARSGSGQIVVVQGEPGIGKSRLVHVLRELIAAQPSMSLIYQCSPDRTSSALYPVIAQIEYAANITISDSPTNKLGKLEALFGAPDSELLVPIAELMAIPSAGEYTPAALSPQERKRRMLQALVDWLKDLTTIRPVLLLIEDAHWIDPTTEEFISFAIPRLLGKAILIVITTRQDTTAAVSYPNATNLILSPLAEDECARLVQGLARGKLLPESVIKLIMAQTEGVPLFLEELTKAVIGSELLREREHDFVLTAGPPSLSIPSTLRDLLMARLDLLRSSKDMAQLAAVIGRSFSYELISQVAASHKERVDAALQELAEADLLIVAGKGPNATYTFKHALIHDAAYETLLHSKRRLLHGTVAAVLDASFPDLANAQPELLAHHLTSADKFAAAARQWHRAGILATERSANQEAVIHFENALAMLERIQLDQRERRLELDILIRLAGALRTTRGYAAVEIGNVTRRALDLARHLGSNVSSLQALNGLYSFHLVRSEYALAEEVGQELLEEAIRSEDATYTMIGYRAVGAVSFHLGRLKKAEENLQRALNLYDVQRHVYLTTLYGSDHGETCACFLSLTKWVLGAEQEAIALQSWGVDHASTIHHAHSVAQAYAYRSFLFCLCGDPERIEADGHSALRISAEHGLTLMDGFARCTLAVAQAIRAPSIDRAAALGQAMDGLHAIAPDALQPFFISVAARVHDRLGMTTKGRDLIHKADAIMQRTGERWAEAEVRRVESLLLANSGQLAAAERCLRDSLTIAQAQSAAGWIVRIAPDLSALLERTGRVDEARAFATTHPIASS
jgi:class 3 adenylate cyclase/tetratricopeptide (TPR) repeat protein